MAYKDNQPIVQSVLYDGYGNAVGVVLDGTIYRLQVEGLMTSQEYDDDGNLVSVHPDITEGQLNVVDNHANVTLHCILEVLKKIDRRLKKLESET